MIRRLELWQLVAADPVARVRDVRRVRESYERLAGETSGVRRVQVDASVATDDDADLVLTIDLDDAPSLARLAGSAAWREAEADAASCAASRTVIVVEA